MKKTLWSCAALLTLCVTAECLTCDTCDVSVLGYCLSQAAVNCTKTQDRCYAAVAKFSAELLDIHAKGCIAASDCRNDTGSILSVNYTITRTCCSTNLCNRATDIQLPLTAAICAALIAVWSQWSL